MDYKHLECLVLAQAITDHKQLVSFVNIEWSQPLGFSLKMRRPPKENRDSSQSLRLYCGMSKCNLSKNNMINIEAETGLVEETCYFALSFRFII
jgi:hypothetical protein